MAGYGSEFSPQAKATKTAPAVPKSNATDLAFSGVAFIPVVGWVISGIYFLGNEAVKSSTGHSIGYHFGNFVDGLQEVGVGKDFNGNVIAGGDYQLH